MIQDLLTLTDSAAIELKPTELQIAYMAGVVDADGSIGIVSLAKHKRHIIKLSVSNTNKEMIHIFETFFGGKMRLRIWKGEHKANWKPCYEWCITTDKAAVAIKMLCPYLIVKKAQALIALRLDKLKKATNSAKCRWDAKYNNRRIKLYDRLKERCGRLNQRGVLYSDTRSYSGIQKNSSIREKATTISSCL